MLTKQDLAQIQKVIRVETKKIVREEIESESENLKNELQGDIKMAEIRIISELNQINNRLKNLEIKVTRIQKDLKTAVNFLDKEGLKIIKRIEIIEKHLNLSSPTS